jgi:hypothetical protein
MMHTIALLAVFAATAAFVALLLIREKLRMEKRYLRHAKVFFDNAEKVLKSGVAPEEFCSTIRFAALRIDKSDSAYNLFRVMRGDMAEVQEEIRGEFKRRENLFEDLERKHPEIAEAYTTALAAGILAVTNTNVFYGGLIRFGIGRLIKRHADWGPTVVMDSQAASGKLFNNSHVAHV